MYDFISAATITLGIDTEDGKGFHDNLYQTTINNNWYK